MSRLPGHLGRAILMAAGELGMAGAARLFVRELAALGGDELVADVCDSYGREYPVLDFVAHRWLLGDRTLHLELDRVSQALEGIKRLLVVGLETDELDGRVQVLPHVDIEHGSALGSCGIASQTASTVGGVRGFGALGLCRIFSVFDDCDVWPICASVDGAR